MAKGGKYQSCALQKENTYTHTHIYGRFKVVNYATSVIQLFLHRMKMLVK